MIRCTLHNRLTYYYVPNNMTKVKYGNMSDFAILINLLVNKVIIAKKTISLLGWKNQHIYALKLNIRIIFQLLVFLMIL